MSKHSDQVSKTLNQCFNDFFSSFIPTRPRFCFRHWFLDYFFCPLLSSHVYPLAISMFKICVEIPHSNGSDRLGRVFLMNTHENLKYSTFSTLLSFLCTLGDEPIKVYWTPNSKIYFIFSVLGSMLMALLPTNHVETQRPGVKNIEPMP